MHQIVGIQLHEIAAAQLPQSHAQHVTLFSFITPELANNGRASRTDCQELDSVMFNFRDVRALMTAYKNAVGLVALILDRLKCLLQKA